VKGSKVAGIFQPVKGKVAEKLKVPGKLSFNLIKTQAALVRALNSALPDFPVTKDGKEGSKTLAAREVRGGPRRILRGISTGALFTSPIVVYFICRS
jgi:hypothetical protein